MATDVQTGPEKAMEPPTGPAPATPTGPLGKEHRLGDSGGKNAEHLDDVAKVKGVPGKPASRD
jgi:hypothetical protein